MKTLSPDTPSPRIVMFGLLCAFTDAVATQLSARGCVPAAALIPGPPGIEPPLRVQLPDRTLPIAGGAAHQSATLYPTFRIGQLTSPSTIALIESLEPDVIVVACFPRLIPRAIRSIPRMVAINIHPSLLPAHRGPDPLFWIMRDGGAGCGVTVHELSGKLDAGAILAARAVPYPDGTREHQLERLLAATGAELAAEVIDSQMAGAFQPRAQDERAASYESWPTAEDFTITTDDPVLHAWNFIRGVAGRGTPIRIDSGTVAVSVVDALDYESSTDRPVSATESQVIVPFRDGWLLAQTEDPTSH